MERVSLDEGRHFAVTDDQSRWLVEGDDSIVIFDGATFEELRRLPFPAGRSACAWLELIDNDRRVLALFQDRLCSYRLTDGKLLHESSIEDEGAERICLSPDESSIMVVSQNYVRWFTPEDLRLQHESKVDFSLFTFAKYSESGKWIAVGRQDGTIELLEASTRRRGHLLHGHREGVDDCIFISQDRVIASVSSDDSLRFWDVASGRELGKLDLGESLSGYRLHFSDRQQSLYLLQPDAPIRQFSGLRN
jgi:WD40 repeat protein